MSKVTNTVTIYFVLIFYFGEYMSTAFASLVLLIVFTLVFLIISLAKLIYYGKKVILFKDEQKEKMTLLHVKHVNNFLLSLITAIVLVELLVLERGGRQGDPLLFKVHLCCDVVTVAVLFTMWFLITGNDDAKKHKQLAKVFYVFFPLVFVTGTLLMVQILMKS